MNVWSECEDIRTPDRFSDFIVCTYSWDSCGMHFGVTAVLNILPYRFWWQNLGDVLQHFSITLKISKWQSLLQLRCFCQTSYGNKTKTNKMISDTGNFNDKIDYCFTATPWFVNIFLPFQKNESWYFYDGMAGSTTALLENVILLIIVTPYTEKCIKCSLLNPK